MKYLTVVVDDRVGLIADISYILSKAKINIESINGVVAVGNKTIITLGVKDFKRAKEVLSNSGYTPIEKDALVLRLEDKPGELSVVAGILKEHKVTINSVSTLSKDKDYTAIAISVDKPKLAKKLLEKYII